MCWKDRQRFEAEFPEWRVEQVRLLMPFRYLLSGGMTRFSFMPGWSFPVWERLERALRPCMGTLAMFACIVLRRVEDAPSAV